MEILEFACLVSVGLQYIISCQINLVYDTDLIILMAILDDQVCVSAAQLSFEIMRGRAVVVASVCFSSTENFQP